MIEISLATERDIEGIAALEAEAFVDPWSLRSLDAAVSRDMVTVLAARERGRVIGYLIYYHIVNEGEIARIAVAGSHRRQRIGGRLLETMISRGEEEGLNEYSLEVRESNLAAISLYRTFSFAEEGRRKAYYSHPTEDGLVMWRRAEQSVEM